MNNLVAAVALLTLTACVSNPTRSLQERVERACAGMACDSPRHARHAALADAMAAARSFCVVHGPDSVRLPEPLTAHLRRYQTVVVATGEPDAAAKAATLYQRLAAKVSVSAAKTVKCPRQFYVDRDGLHLEPPSPSLRRAGNAVVAIGPAG